MAFVLLSDDIEPNDTIPIEHTCDGDDRSPPLTWHGAPAETAAYALVVHDPDAPRGDWVHWVVFDLPATTRSLPNGVPRARTVDGGAQGTNDFGKLGWGGPCPPPGAAHRYVFELYALDAPLGLPPGSKRADVERAMQGRVLARTELVGRYARPTTEG
jgi:Raf kinase inhibitor-like YbhB/YbcL family protein